MIVHRDKSRSIFLQGNLVEWIRPTSESKENLKNV